MSSKIRETNEEDDRVEPLVAEEEGHHEEGDAEEDGHVGDQLDEVVQLLGDRSLALAQVRGEVGDPSDGLFLRENI
jgi:hypothetical protein